MIGAFVASRRMSVAVGLAVRGRVDARHGLGVVSVVSSVEPGEVGDKRWVVDVGLCVFCAATAYR
jgi:hypothetical protein